MKTLVSAILISSFTLSAAFGGDDDQGEFQMGGYPNRPVRVKVKKPNVCDRSLADNDFRNMQSTEMPPENMQSADHSNAPNMQKPVDSTAYQMGDRRRTENRENHNRQMGDNRDTNSGQMQ